VRSCPVDVAGRRQQVPQLALLPPPSPPLPTLTTPHHPSPPLITPHHPSPPLTPPHHPSPPLTTPHHPSSPPPPPPLTTPPTAHHPSPPLTTSHHPSHRYGNRGMRIDYVLLPYTMLPRLLSSVICGHGTLRREYTGSRINYHLLITVSCHRSAALRVSRIGSLPHRGEDSSCRRLG
jgi:hypothetical protein